jgi:hypothetical protein
MFREEKHTTYMVVYTPGPRPLKTAKNHPLGSAEWASLPRKCLLSGQYSGTQGTTMSDIEVKMQMQSHAITLGVMQKRPLRNGFPGMCAATDRTWRFWILTSQMKEEKKRKL